jgi:hypothetical protein
MQNVKVGMQNMKDLKDRTKNFALRIIRMYTALPKSTEAKIVGTQVLRSGTTVGANYREAYRTAYWFELLIEGEILSENKLSGLLQESKELTAIFVTIIKNTKTNAKKKLTNS